MYAGCAQPEDSEPSTAARAGVSVHDISGRAPGGPRHGPAWAPPQGAASGPTRPDDERTAHMTTTTATSAGSASDGTDTTAALPGRSGAGPVPGRRRLVAARARQRVRACGRLGATVSRRVREVGVDAGMATAEYAIVTLAAVGFAGLLVVILKGGEVKSLLTGIVRQALSQ